MEAEPPKVDGPSVIPVCDRCHKLIHHSSGVPIHHPAVESIRDTIWESPWKYNYIYHVLDAADFPLSLLSQLHKTLSLEPPRSQNRRSKIDRYSKGRKNEVHFIITRSDLLAPKKEQVDSLMPYLIEVLRNVLGTTTRNIRLGNVRCVSAKRGWWTRQLKEDIWRRGGGGWMVGKVNVGKSNLFESVFPKGHTDAAGSESQKGALGMQKGAGEDVENGRLTGTRPDLKARDIFNEEQSHLNQELDEESLLPPLQPESNYPTMPLVSSLPGTTASPIRLSYGNGKGELVDLPGLSRGHLEQYVQEEHRPQLVMRSRVRPTQQVIKPGQSLLLGGLIRITSLMQDNVILAYAFTPVDPHLTSTTKAISVQNQEGSSGIQSIAAPGAGSSVQSAGVFQLRWDVTRQRAGPLTGRSAVGLKVENLPFRVMATDILIEGCGWVELVAQVRRRPRGDPTLQNDEEINSEDAEVNSEDAEKGSQISEDAQSFPEVEVFSPEGKFIGQRKPMNAWLFNVNSKPADERKGRPRKSMKGAKKGERIARRAAMGIIN